MPEGSIDKHDELGNLILIPDSLRSGMDVSSALRKVKSRAIDRHVNTRPISFLFARRLLWQGLTESVYQEIGAEKGGASRETRSFG